MLKGYSSAVQPLEAEILFKNEKGKWIFRISRELLYFLLT